MYYLLLYLAFWTSVIGDDRSQYILFIYLFHNRQKIHYKQIINNFFYYSLDRIINCIVFERGKIEKSSSSYENEKIIFIFPVITFKTLGKNVLRKILYSEEKGL